jgi:heat shock protein HtpX
MTTDSRTLRFDYKRLWHSWWSVPLRLVLASSASFYLVFLQLHSLCTTCGPQGSANIPYFSLGCGLFIGLCGFGQGRKLNRNSRDAIATAFQAVYLDTNHPLTWRVHALAKKLRLPPPAVGKMNTANAFAVGAKVNEASVIIGEPLISLLTDEELDAVIGHELGHIACGDVQRMQFAIGYQLLFDQLFQGTAVGAVTGAKVTQAIPTRRGELSEGIQVSVGLAFIVVGLLALVFRYIFGIASELLVMGLSRAREFHADAIGAMLTSREAMMGALQKIHRLSDTPSKHYQAMLFSGRRRGYLFATHPPVEARLRALRSGRHLARVIALADAGRPFPEHWLVKTAAWLTGDATGQKVLAVSTAVLGVWGFFYFVEPLRRLSELRLFTPQVSSAAVVTAPELPVVHHMAGNKGPLRRTARPAVALMQAAITTVNLTERAKTVPTAPALKNLAELQQRAQKAGLHPGLAPELLRQLTARDLENAMVAVYTAFDATADGSVFVWPAPAHAGDALYRVRLSTGSRQGCRKYQVNIEKAGQTWQTPAMELCARGG